MKRFLAVIIAAMLLLSGCASDEYVMKETVEAVESIEDLCAQSGVDMKIPSTAKNCEFGIINSFIAKAKYSFNSVIFVHRASKVTSGSQLSGVTESSNGETTITLGERAEVTIKTYESGGREATWYKDGTYNSLYTEHSASDDLFTELCDLIIA